MISIGQTTRTGCAVRRYPYRECTALTAALSTILGRISDTLYSAVGEELDTVGVSLIIFLGNMESIVEKCNVCGGAVIHLPLEVMTKIEAGDFLNSSI